MQEELEMYKILAEAEDDIKNEFGKPASEVITRLRRKYGD